MAELLAPVPAAFATRAGLLPMPKSGLAVDLAAPTLPALRVSQPSFHLYGEETGGVGVAGSGPRPQCQHAHQEPLSGAMLCQPLHLAIVLRVRDG